ncbi:hypothetical protein UAO_00785 [Enterococcus villorum ATCC 700913]|uniref:Uncharacterized protein n=1 Tax=Enterococcus villorum ATCC 700913 TaxID=1158604 RepID=A0ABN0KI72_9ENTE|nr:hypothetical protein UAO_00785 [Enterococcus villorum ATCC 700913]EOW76830.1 hypothetical protein I591_02138 [Enterococcus villorum ATCC 700913]
MNNEEKNKEQQRNFHKELNEKIQQQNLKKK